MTPSLEATAFLFVLFIVGPTALGEQDIEAGRIHERGFVLVAAPVGPGVCGPCRTGAAGGGDFNGDGFDDFVATWINPSSDPSLWEASALLVYGGDSGPGRYEVEDLLASSDAVLFSLGLLPKLPYVVQASFLGDLNGDGRSELSLGFNNLKNNSDPEVTYIVFGREGLSGEVSLAGAGQAGLEVVEITTTDARVLEVGQYVEAVGDVNGDGRTDIALLTSRQADDGPGLAFVLYGPEGEWSPRIDLAQVGSNVPGFVLRGRTVLRELSDGSFRERPETLHYVRRSGDVNGDGFDDFSFASDASGGDRVYLVLGSGERQAFVDLGREPDGVVQIYGGEVDTFRKVWLSGIVPQGVSVDDLNGDGFDDFLLAVSFKEFLSTDDRALLVFGQRDFPARIDLSARVGGSFPFPAMTFHSWDRPKLKADGFGNYLAAAGDVNEDGVPDFLIGASDSAAGGVTARGRAYVIYGERDWEAGDIFLNQGFEGLRITGEELWDAFGSIVEPAGDFNGDGKRDVLFVAPEIGVSSNPESIRPSAP